MTATARWRLLASILAPALAAAALGAALQAAEPRVLLYASVAPGLLAVIIGVLVSVALALSALARRRAALAVTAAEREAAARAAQDRLRFLMRLDHELKNPLTAIRAGLANAEQAQGGAADQALASVASQAGRIGRLLGDLRKLAELESREIETAPVDLPGLLQEAGEAVAALPGAGERDIQWTVPQAPWPLPLIEGDRDLLLITLQNLLSNAVKFTVPGDRVEVRASEDGDWVVLEVADTGMGIPGDEIGEVWADLARGRAARSLPGTGIGLALVRIIVGRHNGRVALRSREGQGTVVSVRLPVRRRARTAPAVAGLRQRHDPADTAPS